MNSMNGLVCWSLTSLCHSNGHIETIMKSMELGQGQNLPSQFHLEILFQQPQSHAMVVQGAATTPAQGTATTPAQRTATAPAQRTANAPVQDSSSENGHRSSSENGHRSGSGMTQFSQEWARRKVVVKHSIKSKNPAQGTATTPAQEMVLLEFNVSLSQ